NQRPQRVTVPNNRPLVRPLLSDSSYELFLNLLQQPKAMTVHLNNESYNPLFGYRLTF
ncbi:hypothetical protein HAX54_025722, partial [Datura stramonium]|nr:hypothetical protein [Datura stramonium]